MNAAQTGNVECVKYVVDQGLRLEEEDSNLATYAALGGNVECLKYVVEKVDGRMDEDTSQQAAMGGSLECVK